MKTTICVFGASITHGVWDPEGGGWVGRLRSYFDKNFDTEDNYVNTYNLGVGGDTTDDLLERFKTETEAREPDIIIFAIGINDSQYVDSKDNPRISLEKFQKNLTELLRQANKFTQKIIFVGLTKVDESKTMPVLWNRRHYYTNKNVVEYDSALKSFCKENKILFIDTLDLLNKEDLDEDDGLHPNSQGHQKMFEKIKDFLLNNKVVEK